MLLHGPTNSWGVISFEIKWGVAGRSTAIALCKVCEWKMATFMSALWDTLRWQGSTALYSGYKDHREYSGQDRHHKSGCLKLWFEIRHYISQTKCAVAAALRIYGATLKRHLAASLPSPRNIFTKNEACLLLPLHVDSFVFPQCALT